MKKNNKFSIRKYSVGVVSVIIGLFILTGVNSDDRVYAASNESVTTLPPISDVPEGGNPGGVDKIVDNNNDICIFKELIYICDKVGVGSILKPKNEMRVACSRLGFESRKDWVGDNPEMIRK